MEYVIAKSFTFDFFLNIKNCANRKNRRMKYVMHEPAWKRLKSGPYCCKFILKRPKIALDSFLQQHNNDDDNDNDNKTMMVV